MTQLAKHPLKWRLADVAGTGVQQVNVVMPELDVHSQHEILLSTDIPSPHSVVEDIGWTDDDISLFHLLLRKMLDMEMDASATLDLADADVVDILHVVAAAHFIAPCHGEAFLAADVATTMTEWDIGDLAAIHTEVGYKSCIISALDSIEATCVLLESVEGCSGGRDLEVYDTLLINKHSILPAEFGNVIPGVDCTIH
ncbi:MAG: hypothetical protein RPR40_10915 [Bermanella sp.]